MNFSTKTYTHWKGLSHGSLLLQVRLLFSTKILLFFLFLHENICLGYSLEVSHWGYEWTLHQITGHWVYYGEWLHLVEFLHFYARPPHKWRGIMVSSWSSVCLFAHPLVCLSSVNLHFHFRIITWVNVIGFSPNMVYGLILWKSGLGLSVGKFHLVLTELPAHDRIMWGEWGVSFHVFIYIYDFLFCFSVNQSSSEKRYTLKRNNLLRRGANSFILE